MIRCCKQPLVHRVRQRHRRGRTAPPHGRSDETVLGRHFTLPLARVCSVLPDSDRYGFDPTRRRLSAGVRRPRVRSGRCAQASTVSRRGVSSVAPRSVAFFVRALVGDPSRLGARPRRAEQLRHVHRGAGRVGDRGRADGLDERLAAPDVGVDGAQLARLLDPPDELLRRHLVLLRLEHDPLGQLSWSDRHLLGIGQLVEHEPHADRLLGVLAGLGVELLAGLAVLVEELGELLLVVVERVDRVVHARVELGLDDALGQRHLGGVDERVEHLVAGRRELLHLLDAAEAGAQVGGQLVERVELAGQLGELVVGVGELRAP